MRFARKGAKGWVNRERKEKRGVGWNKWGQSGGLINQRKAAPHMFLKAPEPTRPSVFGYVEESRVRWCTLYTCAPM